VVGVLPRTLLKVLSRLAVPVQPPHVHIEEVSAQAKEQVLSSQESSLEVAPVLLASLDISPSLVFNWASHSWSPVQSVWPSLDIPELGPDDIGPTPTNCDPVPDYFHVLLEVLDCSVLTLVASNGTVLFPVPLVLQILF